MKSQVKVNGLYFFPMFTSLVNCRWSIKDGKIERNLKNDEALHFTDKETLAQRC